MVNFREYFVSIRCQKSARGVIPVIDSIEAVPVNFLSKTVRTRTGRQITLSYRALSSY